MIKFNTAFWNQYWECSGIYIERLGSSVADINMIQNDVIKFESVVVYCNTVILVLLVIKFNTACWYQYLECTGIYIERQVHHSADIKYDTKWCNSAWECCRIL